MSHYLIAKITIDDREEYRRYETGFMAVFERFEGKLLSADEAPHVLEGNWLVTRTVLIEFPSSEAALAWYQSEDYQAIAQHRFAASKGDVVLISGLPGQ